jgi:hypothetical protein
MAEPKPASSKTRWCEICTRRHRLDHEHFKRGRPSRADVQVVGSDSAEGLADRFDQEVGGRKPPTAAEAAQKMQEEREALERRWGRRMRLVYGAASKLIGDPKIALNDEEEKDFGQVHADFAMAWGIAGNSKLETAIDLATVHGMAITARSDFLTALLEAKEEETDKELPTPVIQ